MIPKPLKENMSKENYRPILIKTVSDKNLKRTLMNWIQQYILKDSKVKANLEM